MLTVVFALTYVFVVFNCDTNWNNFNNYTAQACNPAQLEVVKGGEEDGLSLANGAVTYRQEIEKYKEALEHIIEYWNKDKNHGAMSDALDEILNTAEQALKGE